MAGGHNMATAHLKSLVRADHLLDAYFEDPWNVMDALNYTMALIVIAIEVQARLQLHNAVDLINEQHTNFTSETAEAVVSREEFFSMFVSVYGPGYLSELAYSMMGAFIQRHSCFHYSSVLTPFLCHSSSLQQA